MRDEMDHRTREFVSRWAKAKAARTGIAQALVHNEAMDIYMYETVEEWESSKHRRHNCRLVEVFTPLAV